MIKKIENQTFDEERALYHLEDAEVNHCTFAGPADGESALKEARNVTVSGCSFSLRYPLWHTHVFLLRDCSMDALTRAALWYSTQGSIADCRIDGIKCLRECEDISMKHCTVNSPEFGWRSRRLSFTDCEMESEYFLFEARDITIDNMKMKGKYSFQYIENMHIDHSMLDTKDAFWHSRNVTVENSTVRGEYLGWYSEGLTLINCHIVGTQPLCYCTGLRLVGCTMEGTDLAFEYSEVDADIRGELLSVKNPKSGRVAADKIGEIILEDSIMENHCEIHERL